MTLRVKSLADLPQAVRVLNTDAAPAPPAENPPLYLNQPQEMDGYRFASKSEWQRYMTLKAMQESRLIEGLRVHPSYALHVNGIHIGDYVGDFEFRRDGKLVVEDCKSPRTVELGLFRWKWRHMRAEYGIEVSVSMKRWKRNLE